MELKLKAGQFYGDTAQALISNGFSFTEKLYSSKVKLPVHAHELSHFCFVLAGNYKEKMGYNIIIDPCFQIPPDIKKSWVMS